MTEPPADAALVLPATLTTELPPAMAQRPADRPSTPARRAGLRDERENGRGPPDPRPLACFERPVMASYGSFWSSVITFCGTVFACATIEVPACCRI